ncbi:MAG: DNA-binding transcriptional regulator [Planctomycetota bacterium]|nr:DNA-binding transcriptional regulator [Planctomycetota bacterium]
MPTLTHSPTVALLIETSNAYARGLLRGIRAYMHEHDSWSVWLGEQRRGESAPSWLANWNGDGIIARIESPEIAKAVKKSQLPAIDVSAARYLPEVPYVETDDKEIARLAFEHLSERGFRNYAYCGDPEFGWSQWRQKYFCRQVEQAGFQCNVYESKSPTPSAPDWYQEREAVGQWLQSLPKPVGIMAAYDVRGRQLLDICRSEGLHVPDEVAVIGVDNDEVLCELADPPLTSVVPDAHRTGYEAAHLLDRMMRGETLAGGAHLVKPAGIVTRKSTDVFATEDAEISAAVRFIRENAIRGIKVADVLAALPLSRRELELRFKKILGRTPHEEIVRIQIDRVKQLLVESSLPLAVIAHRAGYKHVEYMTVAFKRETGHNPSDYRTAHQNRGGSLPR